MTQVFTDRIEAWVGVNVQNYQYRNRTQVFTDRIEAWVGVNVQNYQYRNSPIKSYPQYGEEVLNLSERNENTTMAYIGAMYRPVDWCVLQLDYTYEYADLFKSADFQPDIHTVSIWAW